MEFDAGIPMSRAPLTEGPSLNQDAIWQMNLRSTETMEHEYPERPGEPDCSYYIRTGLCRFGATCRFNHPPNRNLAIATARMKGEFPERIGQPECQYYLKTGTCKFGATCKFHHPRDKAGIAGRVSLNILGYPLRPNEIECAYYLRTGQCKFGSTCKFHHPQPTNMMVSLGGSPVYPAVHSPTTPSQQSYAGFGNPFFSLLIFFFKIFVRVEQGMNGVAILEPDETEFVEIDPTGRYGRYNEILGKGASKTVYRAFDEYEGIEVAWNQVKLYDFLQSAEDLERLYCEIHLLKTLTHSNIMKFYTSWVDTANRNINFVTEMFTSGTLRQYRLKHRRVNIRAVKHWCRQILKGLLYLHSLDPPVIHRDLKCDNIFVNGNQGEVKIGDLGLAAILRKSHAARCVGTPEFMAPEVYEEKYNELVDIYSFGMCILEMVTFEYPYSECTHPAQIYKKVISGKKPEALYKVQDPEVRKFVEKCIASVSCRLSAGELLKDPFLQIDDYESDLRLIECYRNFDEAATLLRQPLDGTHHSSSSMINGYASYLGHEAEYDLDYYPLEVEKTGIDLFISQEHEHLADVDITIKGRRREDDGIFLRLRIADKEGIIRNIYFPFDIVSDTALSVAAEMVAELDLTDQDVMKIADMIDGEIAALVPDWKRGLGIDESLHCTSAGFCHNCASKGSLSDYFSFSSPSDKNLQILQCPNHGCAAVHGRFEEITYQVEGSEQCVTEGAPNASSHSDYIHYSDIWAQREVPELSSQGSRDSTHEILDGTTFKEEIIINTDNESESNSRNSFSKNPSESFVILDDYENEIRQELRWLKAKYQMQLRGLIDQQLGVKSKSPSSSPNSANLDHRKDNGVSFFSGSSPNAENNGPLPKPLSSGKLFTSYFPVDPEEKIANLAQQNVHTCAATNESCSPDQMLTAKSFYSGALLPNSLHRATSLPVDAIDV